MINHVFYTDPSHGWLAVEIEKINELNIAHKISEYSYLGKNHVYLEEDVDASIYLRAYEEKYGKKPELKVEHSNASSFVRNLPSFPNFEFTKAS
ncbi:MAG: hypothetical protein Unbinned4512contig1001_1 [Prokaryotic dsDNA virus sp.]|nr:MAG: hypothetical protein Unbinned4512contig1001_1 [Prokaryotic dsDNA virus sp.]|tara:strand:+ start:63 stop:344 length:282 start_codon:yes stop_codon:yes gene_type:complete